MSNTKKKLVLWSVAALLAAPPVLANPPAKPISLELAGTYSQPDPAGAFDASAAEIAAYDAASQRLFVTNADAGTIDILDISDVSKPMRVGQINVTDNESFNGFIGGGANSVAVNNGLVAAAVEADTKTDPGAVALFDTQGSFLKLLAVGALPDMLTFTPDGRRIIVANEGEPDDGIDPEGSISVIDLGWGVDAAAVATADFNAFDRRAAKLRARGIRLFPDVGVPPLEPGQISVSQDLEPEYIAIGPRGRVAVVTLQEANALAVVDIHHARVKTILPLGSKSHKHPASGLDPSDRDDGINIKPWPVRGLYLPDAIASYSVYGRTFYITANEGDDRGDADEDARGDAVRYKDIGDVISFGRDDGLDQSEALAALKLDDDEKLGRLNISTIDGLDDDGDLNQLYAYGARSFTIWNAMGRPVWDSGDDLEQITAAEYPDYFNASNDANEDDGEPALDDRSDNKGPEPEAVTVAKLYGRHYAFVGLERIGGVVVYDVTWPRSPRFITYVNNRDFTVDNEQLEQGLAGDLGPESIVIIKGQDSPTGRPLMVVANEVSGTVSIYNITGQERRPWFWHRRF